jgi:GWxTD domain-containing protein
VVLTGTELEALAAAPSETAAARLMDLAWARRDPHPGTPANELRSTIAARIRSADEQPAEPGRRGALTDRGRVFLLLGPPAERRRTSVATYLEELYRDGHAGTTTSARPAPLSPVAPGVYMFGSELPLDELPAAGRYRLEVTVTDRVADVARTTSIPFEVVDEPST